MRLSNGFYIHVTYIVNSGKKYQHVRSFFEIKDNHIILYGSSYFYRKEFFDDYLSGQSYELISTDENVVCEFLRNLPHLVFPSFFKEEFIKTKLNCGEKYFNVYRPCFNVAIAEKREEAGLIDNKPFFSDYEDAKISNNQEYYNLLNQLEILVDELNSVFKTIAPQKANLQVYGHDIRNIIILACTEIDAMMMRVLKKNGIKEQGHFYNMKDYIKLSKPLRLQEYSINFTRYFDLSNFSPYSDWNDSLVWYDAYNKIKHDREVNFSMATLENAINSISAFAIMLIAQFGYRNTLWTDKIGKILEISTEPNWSIEDFYIPRRDSDPIFVLNEEGLKYPF